MTKQALNLLVDENINGWQRYLAPLGEVKTMSGRDIDASSLADIDALLVRSVTPVNADLIRHARRLQFVGTATAGVDHIDLSALAAQGVAFSAAPGSNANSVVEYVLAAIAAHDQALERLLGGGTVGVIGCGHVGGLLLRRLRALGITTRSYDPWLDGNGVIGADSLEKVLACDVVSLHPSLHHNAPWPSYHLLNATTLTQLVDHCLLINASRGAVIDQQALLSWMCAHPQADVVLDAWENEPFIDAMLARRVFLGTPHIAGYSVDAKWRATHYLAQALTTHFDLPAVSDSQRDKALSPVVLESAEPIIMLKQLLASRYAIADDHQRLQALWRANLATDERGAGFDALRKQYPVRRELAGSPVIVQCDVGARWAQALGACVDRS